VAPDGVGVCGEIDAGGRRLQVGQDRHAAEPGDQQAGEHRHPDRQPDEMPGAQESQ
jgi:hypothetical protein